MLRPLLAASAGVVLLATTAVLANGATGSAPSAGSPGSVEWAPCDDKPDIECATLTRPIDPDRPGGATFDMALARHRATDPDRRIGALVINPGGPGVSGVEHTYGSRYNFSPEILARFDIVGFDPRGVGLSQPVRCSTDLYFDGPSSHPTDAAGFDSLAKYNRKLHADCAKHSGPVVNHVSTEDVVGDIDALRKALGERQISFYGLSYGTAIGQRYAERHGDKVRAMVLDSVVDRGADARSLVESSARAAADVYEEWKRWNARNPSAPLHGRDIDALWDDLMAKAANGELVDHEGSGEQVTPDLLGSELANSAYAPDWEGLSWRVLSLNGEGTGEPGEDEGDSSSSGEPEADDDTSSPFEPGPGNHDTPPSEESEDPDTSLYAGPMAHITCADTGFRVRDFAEFAELERLGQQISPRTLGGHRANALITGCVGLPEARTPQRPATMRTKVPTLLLNARYDVATPLEDATSVHRQQKKSTVLVTYEGAGHGVYERSDCTKRVSDDYLVSLEVPRNGFSCPATDD